MRINYLNIIIPGTIGGVFIGFLKIISCCGWPFDIVILFMAGFLAVHLSKPDITAPDDPVTIGMLSGGFTGLVGGIVYAIVAMVLVLMIGSLSLYDTSSDSALASIGIISFLTGVGEIVCCLPSFIVGGILLGGLAGLAYASLVLKI
jgi:hypothetical protein